MENEELDGQTVTTGETVSAENQAVSNEESKSQLEQFADDLE